MSNVEELYQNKARRDDSDGFIKMKGTFKPSPFTDRTYDHVFVPNDTGPATVVIPVYDSHGLIDIVGVRAMCGVLSRAVASISARYLIRLAFIRRQPIGSHPIAASCRCRNRFYGRCRTRRLSRNLTERNAGNFALQSLLAISAGQHRTEP
jgi:hypothetical protein